MGTVLNTLLALAVTIGVCAAMELSTPAANATSSGANARVTVQQTLAEPPTYVILLTNAGGAPLTDLAIGTGDPKPGTGPNRWEITSVLMNVPTSIEAPDGWRGATRYIEESDGMGIAWNLQERTKALQPGASACGFRLTLPGAPENRPVEVGDYAGMRQVNFHGIGFFVAAADGNFRGIVRSILLSPRRLEPVLVTAQQVSAAPLGYVLLVSNLANVPIESVVLGGEGSQSSAGGFAAPTRLGLPPGWAASSAGPPAVGAAGYVWRAQDRSKALRPGESRCDFRMEFEPADLARKAPAPRKAAPLPTRLEGLSFTARAADGRDFRGTVRVDALQR
jgi:hypothetical protein